MRLIQVEGKGYLLIKKDYQYIHSSMVYPS